MLAAAVLGLVSCEGGVFAPDELDAPIRTSATEYALETTSIGWEIAIPFSYANRSAGPYLLPNCGGLYEYRLDKWLGDRWAPGYFPVLPLCLSPVIRIEGGTTFVDTLHLFAGFPDGNFSPTFAHRDPQGEYRIVVETLRSYQDRTLPFGPRIPFDDRVSNTFRLVAEDD